MFSSTPAATSFSARAWGIGLGTVIMVGVPVMLVSAKTVQFLLPILLVGAITGALVRGRRDTIALPLGEASLIFFVFLAYAALSALWAPDFREAVATTALAAVIAAGVLLLIQLLSREPLDTAVHMAEGLWIGLLFGMVYSIAEIGSGQAIKIWTYNALGLGPDVLRPPRYFTWEGGRLVSIHSDDITRNVVPIPLLIWPALLAATLLRDLTWRRLVMGALAVTAVAAVFMGTSEAAKLALAAAGLIFVVAQRFPRAALGALGLAWMIAWLAVVPMAHAMAAYDLQNAEWLQYSGRLRVTMWNEIAGLVSDAPILGVGADMTYVIKPPMREAPLATPEWQNHLIPHPHNAYLQVWYELGLVGVLLLIAFGLFTLRQIHNLPTVQRPYGYALFAAAAVQIGLSYSVWQTWFMCLLGFAVAMFNLSHNCVLNQRLGRLAPD